jgi:uncharacterized membrane protein YkvA (DUF1232 family)
MNATTTLLQSTANVDEVGLIDVVTNLNSIENKAKKRSLAQLFKDIKDMLRMVRDYTNGSYREIPFGSIVAIAGALLYVFSPIDLIPDFIPGGLIDDAAVAAACLGLVRSDIDAYRKKNGA